MYLMDIHNAYLIWEFERAYNILAAMAQMVEVPTTLLGLRVRVPAEAEAYNYMHYFFLSTSDGKS